MRSILTVSVHLFLVAKRDLLVKKTTASLASSNFYSLFMEACLKLLIFNWKNTCQGRFVFVLVVRWMYCFVIGPSRLVPIEWLLWKIEETTETSGISLQDWRKAKANADVIRDLLSDLEMEKVRYGRGLCVEREQRGRSLESPKVQGGGGAESESGWEQRGWGTDGGGRGSGRRE